MPTKLLSEDSLCFGSTPLDNRTLSLSFSMVDGFDTPVTGQWISDNSLFMHIHSLNSNCQFFTERHVLAVSNVTGQATFHFSLLGHFDESCELEVDVFTGQGEPEMIIDDLSRLGATECIVSFSACPASSELEFMGEYDLCVRTLLG